MNQFQLALKHSIEQNEDMVQAAANNLLRSAAQGEEWAIVELARQVSLLELSNKSNVDKNNLSETIIPIGMTFAESLQRFLSNSETHYVKS